MRSTPKVILQVRSSDGTSKSFSLTEHDTFLLGRMADCHLCVPDDPQVSRHHFLLEACPPMASLRDLGSMNDTHINGKKCGGREKRGNPGARDASPIPDYSNPSPTSGASPPPFIICLHGKFPYRFDPKRDPSDIILNENPVHDRMP